MNDIDKSRRWFFRKAGAAVATVPLAAYAVKEAELAPVLKELGADAQALISADDRGLATADYGWCTAVPGPVWGKLHP